MNYDISTKKMGRKNEIFIFLIIIILIQVVSILITYIFLVRFDSSYSKNSNKGYIRKLQYEHGKLFLKKFKKFLNGRKRIDVFDMQLYLNKLISEEFNGLNNIRVSYESSDNTFSVLSGKTSRNVEYNSLKFKVDGKFRGVLTIFLPIDFIHMNDINIFRNNRKKILSLYKILFFISILLILFQIFYIYKLYKKIRSKEIEEINEEIENLSAGLAHEIRNPLNSVKFNLKMIEEDLEGIDISEDTISMITSTREEIDRLDKMLKSYMEFAGKWENFKTEKINIDELITDIVSFHREEFSQKGIAIIFKKEGKNFEKNINPQLIRQIIINILINSKDIMTEHGAVYIYLKKIGKKINIIIEDEGPGISEDIIDKIFDPFFSKRNGGFGLGLATVKKIIDNIDGRIYVDNSEKGARFKIEL